ncbi:MAG: adaptor protein MecA [Lachnospiraceae bacterium]
MEFIRVNDHMIKCLISEEDMDQYDVSIEDFFTRTENAMEFLHEIVKQAEIEVDYRPEGPLTSLQIAPIPDKGIAIFLTEKPQLDLKSILQSLKKSAGVEIPDDVMEKVEKSSPKEQADFFGRFMDNIHKEVEKSMAAGNSVEPRKKPADYRAETAEGSGAGKSDLEHKIFAFDCAADVLRYAEVVEMPESIGSSLYKDEDHGTYYLIVERKAVSVETLAGVYLTAYEYGHFVSEREEQILFIKEHCECVIENDAIRKMKSGK